MKQLSMYSTACGDLPKLVRKREAKTFIPYSEFLEFKETIMQIMSDTNHTQYQNMCYANFLLKKYGLTGK